MKKMQVITVACLLVLSFNGLAQQQVSLSNKNNFQSINRNISISTNKQGKTVIHLDAKPGMGVTWIKGLNFSTGTIEFDVKGKDVLQESFVGIAFHGVNDSTYEGVYFRPFNFQAADTNRKKHAVQYICLPKFDWFYLRDNCPDVYEHGIYHYVNPDSWFHVKIIVEKNKVQAFINADEQACLTVTPLAPNQPGKLGFWVGNDSDGDFSNLTVTAN